MDTTRANVYADTHHHAGAHHQSHTLEYPYYSTLHNANATLCDSHALLRDACALLPAGSLIALLENVDLVNDSFRLLISNL